MKILFTNNTLDNRAGTELYVSDVARALVARGHTVTAYSNQLGVIAQEMRSDGVCIIERLEDLGEVPDVIHGHHHLEAMTAMLHFPQVPAILFCHSWKYWEEMPVKFPSIRRYLAMNRATRNRLVCEHGIAPEQVRLMLNFVDLKRFQPRTPLPARPARALVFNNYATELNILPVLRQACALTNISLDVIGSGTATAHARPWEKIGNYDLVFASGRSALEALATGTALIICNFFGLGPMVSTDNLQEMRSYNLGNFATLGKPFTVTEVVKEIQRYNAPDAMEVSRQIRATAGLEETVDQLLALYAEIMAESGPEISQESHTRAAAIYLRQISDRIKQAQNLRHQFEMAQNMLAQQQNQLHAMEQSLTWRLRQRLTRLPGMVAFYRKLRKLPH